MNTAVFPGRRRLTHGVIIREIAPPPAPMRNPPAAPPAGALRFALLDVGQGLAAIIRTRRHLLVYDTGPSFRSGNDTGRMVVAPYLRHHGLSRIDMLVKNGLMGLCLVFLLLWLFLDLRLGFWVGMGIPVSLAGTLALLWFLGESVNMISLFGFILVLGIAEIGLAMNDYLALEADGGGSQSSDATVAIAR